jgi:hypothetical protein
VILKSEDDSEVTEKLSNEPETAIDGLSSGVTVKITVSARNSTGESQPSATITAVVP